ncbi:hypothetical protein [Paenarthrobacter sp. YJN-5]|uniref:hypothetical protein n=1 Tax=Paenarthrobacter sp. YJN-5 TaxID=2735316 RepID=UPI001877F941|nr:hypothetical protein [Paenarthrobacter sp. YJN-5]QOT19620.1 hypothetical protein HMI59_23685 [Paenarthrobacter sp. YJN-5]
MTHPQLTVETVGGSTQATVEGLLQLTVMPDGSVEIQLAGKHVEVERNGLRYVVRHETDSARFGAASGVVPA